MSTGRSRTGSAQDETTSCPDGHLVPPGVRFCPDCGRYVGPPLDEAPWPASGSGTVTVRRQPSPWPGRVLVAVGVVALGFFLFGLVRQGRGVSEAPAASPVTTAAVTTAAPPPTAAPVDKQPCAAPGTRNGGYWCEPTGTGALWRPAPYAGAGDTVGAVGTWPAGALVPSSALVRAGTVAVGAGDPTERSDAGASLWCFSVILQNRDTTTLRYGPEQLGLLDPAGNVAPAVPTSFVPPALGPGELLPGGTATSYVCFAAPAAGPGRYAVTYQPPGSLGRAMLYVDR